MIGILLLTHGELGFQFLTTARLIGLNSEESVAALGIDPTDSPDLLRDQVAQSIKKLDRGKGVLISDRPLWRDPHQSLTFIPGRRQSRGRDRSEPSNDHQSH